MSDSSLEVLYLWDGPPRLQLERRTALQGAGVHHSLRVQNGRPGVVVIAVDEAKQSLLLVRVNRSGRAVIELPRGFGEEQDGPMGAARTARAAAERELREETGYRCWNHRLLGSYSADSSLLPGTVDVVRVEVDRGSQTAPTDGEAVGTQWLKLSTLPDSVRNGVVADGHSLAAIAIFWALR